MKNEREIQSYCEAFYKAFNASPNPMFISKLTEGSLIEVNEKFLEVSGYNREEVLGKTYRELNMWADSGDREKAVSMLNSQGSFKDFEVWARLKSGDLRIGRLSAVAIDIGCEKCMIGIFNDITERKLSEKLLQESNEKYRHLVENAPAGIYEIDFLNLRFTSVNDVMCQYTGYTKEEFLSMSPLDIMSDESKAHFFSRLKRAFSGENVPEITEFRITGKNGRQFWVIISARFIFKNGVPVGASVIAHDITERKIMEEALKNSERFLANIFESIQDRLFVIDTGFNIIRANKKAEQSFLHSLPLVGKKCYKVYYGRETACEGCPCSYTLKYGKSSQSVISTRDRNGNTVSWLDYYCYPLLDDGTGDIRGVIVYARDITERIKTEKEMVRLDRLNLVGEMAASIGHEIRNPMTAVRGFLQMLEDKEECAVYNSYFKVMIDELDRANLIITEFLSLARNKPVELKLQNLNTIISAIMPLIEANAINSKKNIELKFGDIPHLLIDEKDIRQLIHNLVRNGLEAMPQGKKLTISTFMEGENVVLSVKDQGKGIDPGLVDKIGTPFLTTKENGTGLGLAVCYGIADRHNATMSFKTDSQGTTFYVSFRRIQI